MSSAHLVTESTLQAQLDRLVSGDLPAAERRNLLAWLDEEPSRWRQCGLAFLEAQNWAEALETLGEGSRGKEPAVLVSPSARGERVPAHRSFLRMLAMAAGILVALSCGIVIGRQWDAPFSVRPTIASAPHDSQPAAPLPGGEEDKAQVQLATVSVPTDLSPKVPALLQLPVKTPSAGDSAYQPSSIPDHVREQWKRRGFELREERRFLPARLADGREVMLPVNEVQVKYIGKQVY